MDHQGHLNEQHEFYADDGRLTSFAGTETDEDREKLAQMYVGR